MTEAKQENKTVLRTLEEGRAKYAYECVEKVTKDAAKEYKSYVKKLPMLIKTNGLGAATAFVFSKRKEEKGKKNGYAWVYEHLQTWVQKHKPYLLETADPAAKEIAKQIVSLNSPEYRAVTIEVLALLNWLKRFADGMIEGESNES